MRAGRTKTTSFSLDAETMANLRRLAERRHGGNVSALITELSRREIKLAAAEAFFEKYEIPPPDESALAAIEAEWHGERPKRKAKRKRAA